MTEVQKIIDALKISPMSNKQLMARFGAGYATSLARLIARGVIKPQKVNNPDYTGARGQWKIIHQYRVVGEYKPYEHRTEIMVERYKAYLEKRGYTVTAP